MAKKKTDKKEEPENSDKESTEKEKICEIFEVEKDGKEKVVQACGTENKKEATKEQMKYENKILKNFLILIGAIFIAIVLVIYGINSIRNFEYRGIEFEVVKEGNLILYQTTLPVVYNNEKSSYRFFLRKDPRKLNVLVSDAIEFKQNMVLNITSDLDHFNCDGDGVIAIANLINLYGVLEINMMRDENASCDEQGRYMFVQIQPGNETSIEKFGPSCYNLNVKGCEILEVTEQLMIESFAKFSEFNS